MSRRGDPVDVDISDEESDEIDDFVDSSSSFSSSTSLLDEDDGEFFAKEKDEKKYFDHFKRNDVQEKIEIIYRRRIYREAIIVPDDNEHQAFTVGIGDHEDLIITLQWALKTRQLDDIVRTNFKKMPPFFAGDMRAWIYFRKSGGGHSNQCIETNYSRIIFSPIVILFDHDNNCLNSDRFELVKN